MIVFRSQKGSQLTSDEVDGNFQYLLNKFGEGLVSVGNYEVDGFNVSLSGSGWVWRIFDNEYILNPFGFNHTAVPTTSGNVRVEIICGYEDGSIVVLQGPSGAVEVDPPIPNNYVSLLRYVVGNNSITVTNPIAGNSYIRKDSEAFVQVVPATAEFKLNIDNNRNFVINSALEQTTIVGVVKTATNGSTSTDTNWSGSDLHIYRKIGSGQLKVKHHDIPNWTAAGYTLYFPDGQDYDVEEGELLTFKIMQHGTLITNSPIMAFPIYIFAGSSKGGGGGIPELTGDVVSDPNGVTTLEKISSIAEAGKDQIPKVLPNGTMQGEDLFELWVYDDTTSPYTLANLQTLYPTSAGRFQGFEVRCRLLTPPTTYRKESENDSTWIKIEGSNVV